VTATDLVLQITQLLPQEKRRREVRRILRRGLSNLPVADRTTIGNMSPEYGSTIAIFPIDAQTLTYLRLTGRSDEQSRWWKHTRRRRHVPHRCIAGTALHRHARTRQCRIVEPNLAGPRRPQDRVPLKGARAAFENRAR